MKSKKGIKERHGIDTWINGELWDYRKLRKRYIIKRTCRWRKHRKTLENRLHDAFKEK